MVLYDLMAMEQGRKYHEELHIEGECQYSEVWLQKFKKRQGVKQILDLFELLDDALNPTLLFDLHEVTGEDYTRP